MVSKITYIAVFLISFLLAGFLEFYTTLLCFLLGLGWSLSILYLDIKIQKLWLYSLLGCLIGFAAMVYSPGNEIRVNLISLTDSLARYIPYFFYIIKSIWFWFFLVVLLTIWKKLITTFAIFKNNNLWFLSYLTFYIINCGLLFLILSKIDGSPDHEGILLTRIISIFSFIVSFAWLPIKYYIQEKSYTS